MKLGWLCVSVNVSDKVPTGCFFPDQQRLNSRFDKYEFCYCLRPAADEILEA